MFEALDRGNDLFVRLYGKEGRMTERERTSARHILSRGEEVPGFLLKMVCMGLEYMYFCEDRQGEGISGLLGKLAKLCGYQRIGMTMLEMRSTA